MPRLRRFGSAVFTGSRNNKMQSRGSLVISGITTPFCNSSETLLTGSRSAVAPPSLRQSPFQDRSGIGGATAETLRFSSVLFRLRDSLAIERALLSGRRSAVAPPSSPTHNPDPRLRHEVFADSHGRDRTQQRGMRPRPSQAPAI